MYLSVVKIGDTSLQLMMLLGEEVTAVKVLSCDAMKCRIYPPHVHQHHQSKDN